MMRTTVRAPKYLLLAVGIGAIAVVALMLATKGGSAQHDGEFLEFTGPSSGYMEVPDAAALNPTDAITVEAWIYLNTYAGWGTNPLFNDCPMIVGKNWQVSYSLALGCGGDVMDSFVNGDEKYTETPVIPLKTWTHVAMTYDGTTRGNYVNGQVALIATNVPVGPIGDTADPLRIGDDVNWDFSPNGRIDDVRIWNVERTQAEIAAGMNGVASNAPGLVAEWKFDGGSLVDSTGGFTGTLVGDVQIGVQGSETPTPTPTPTGPTPTPSPKPVSRPGDVICDGQIKVDDAGFLLALRAGFNPTPAPFNCAPGGDAADADCNGNHDLFDVLAILKHIVNLIQLPSSCASPTPTPTPI